MVSKSKELRDIEERHENLKKAMVEMEKKMREPEQTVASQNEELKRRQEAEKKWSIPHIRREIDDELAKAAPDTYKIEKLNAKYEAAVKIEEWKSFCLLV